MQAKLIYVKRIHRTTKKKNKLAWSPLPSIVAINWDLVKKLCYFLWIEAMKIEISYAWVYWYFKYLLVNLLHFCLCQHDIFIVLCYAPDPHSTFKFNWIIPIVYVWHTSMWSLYVYMPEYKLIWYMLISKADVCNAIWDVVWFLKTWNGVVQFGYVTKRTCESIQRQ